MRLQAAACLVLLLTTGGSGLAQPQAPRVAPELEKPALAALAAAAPPKAFALEVSAFRVPVPGHTGLVATLVRIPGGSLEFTSDYRLGTFTAGAVVVVRFIDAAGNVAQTESQEFSFSGLLSDGKATLAKPILYSRRADLAPGTYKLQVAVYDEAGKQASVVMQPLEIPAATTPIVGDLMVVEHAEPVTAEHPAEADDPFVFGHFVLRPSMDPGVNRGLQNDLNFILPVVLVPGAVAPPLRLTLFSADGHALSSVPLPFKTPEPNGKLFVVGRIPLAKIPPSKYTLQVAVGTWPDAVIRKSPLTVVD